MASARAAFNVDAEDTAVDTDNCECGGCGVCGGFCDVSGMGSLDGSGDDDSCEAARTGREGGGRAWSCRGFRRCETGLRLRWECNDNGTDCTKVGVIVSKCS